ncbi:pectate lyase-like protein [Rhodovulum imhoffii]|uniref:Pectate lyase-like protein n=1 Tax=Rhodovulum imhoffii TaxID=365340 RepID=A0A2T5BWF7_9RHOB|nr:glycosyl hydrolase family 28-related protein [Rhodovulum imhoffii]MBK5935073.1 hypothetical protein [Rhodovulum imhoffii]PTN03962.1 pectate lyase-like protein [Rhodovulum imhoffii]
MNKAITEGLVLMPRAFADGLDMWSREDGRPGSATYEGAPEAVLETGDADFGDCLELVKTQAVQCLRYMGQTPIRPGCYLRVTAWVKAVSGNLPQVRIATFAAAANGDHVGGAVETGTAVTLATYGEVCEVSAIIGTGNRPGVDMAWGRDAAYAHVGLDLTGPAGGVVRIDDLVVEDVTSVFLREMMDWVDVRDFGARGDGRTDDTAAFEAADAAAGGRSVLVSAGDYWLAGDVTFHSPVRFEGCVAMPAEKRLTLIRNFNLNSYIDAFGDEAEAFRRAVAVLFNYSDHDSLDMMGRRVELAAPIDIQAAVANKNSFSMRRVIRNGQFYVRPGASWETDVVASVAKYQRSNARQLTDVANIANIPVGALVEGVGVGREIYVRAKNVSARTLTLSQPLYAAASSQDYTFRRFKYILDFSGFERLDKFVLDDIEFQCDGASGGVMLPQQGLAFHIRDCFITRPKDRGITSIGEGCAGLTVDRCQFLSNEQPLPAQERTSIALNVNANDCKLRDNRVVRFAHFAVLSGSGNMIADNHWFQGDDEPDGLRQAGIVLTQPNVRSTLTGNYIDNSFIEWTNEHDAWPDFGTGDSFGGLTVAGNNFTAIDVARWFRWIVIKPCGSGHFIDGLNISGNVFKAINGDIARIEHVDTTHAELNMARACNIVVSGNTFAGVEERVQNPVTLRFDTNSAARNWPLEFAPHLPFGGGVRNVVCVVAEGPIMDASGRPVPAMPYTEVEQGAARSKVVLGWPDACRGRVSVTARIDSAL